MNGYYRTQIIFKGNNVSNKILNYLYFDEVDDICLNFNKIIPIKNLQDNSEKLVKWNALNQPTNTKYLKANKNECELIFETDLFFPIKIIEALSNILIDIEIKGQYTSNICGIHSGIFFTTDGTLNVIDFKKFSKESYDVWIDLFEQPTNLVFNTEINNYEWFE